MCKSSGLRILNERRKLPMDRDFSVIGARGFSLVDNCISNLIFLKRWGKFIVAIFTKWSDHVQLHPHPQHNWYQHYRLKIPKRMCILYRTEHLTGTRTALMVLEVHSSNFLTDYRDQQQVQRPRPRRPLFPLLDCLHPV